MKKLIPILILFLLSQSNFSKGQVKSNSVLENVFSDDVMDLHVVSLDDKSVAYISSNTNNELNVICTNNDLQTKWNRKIDGYYLNAFQLGKNLLVVYNTNYKLLQGGEVGDYKAVLLNSLSGEIIAEKMLYGEPNIYIQKSKSFISLDKKTFTFSIAKTQDKKGMKLAPGMIAAVIISTNTYNNSFKTREYSITSFNEKLELIDKVYPELPSGELLGMAKSSTGNTFIAMADNKLGVTISKFKPGQEKSTSTMTDDYYIKSGLFGDNHLSEYLTFMADSLVEDVVYLSGCFKNYGDRTYIFNKYDFKANKKFNFQKDLSKDEAKRISKLVAPNKNYKDFFLGSVDSLRFEKLININDEHFIILTSKRFERGTQPNSMAVFYAANGLLIFRLDKNLEEKEILTIPRSYGNTFNHAEFNSRVDNNVLKIATSEGRKNELLILEIDLIKGEVIKMQTIQPKNVDGSSSLVVKASILEENSITLPVKDFQMLKRRASASLHKISW